MSIVFTYPAVLYGLFLVSIPIIIHLFTFRKYKEVFFHSIFLLKNYQNEENKTRSKLKDILVLITRIITIIAIVIAFAQPFIPSHQFQHQTNEFVTLYIDNSFSMQAETSEGMALELAKTRAFHIMDAYPNTQTFHIITNNPDSRDNIPVIKEDALQRIAGIELSPFSQSFSEVALRASGLSAQNPHTLFILSDFQTHSTDIANSTTDSLLSILCVPLVPERINNLSVDSVWFESPFRVHNQVETITARIQNTGNQTYTQHPVHLFIHDTLRALSTISIEPGQSITVDFEFTLTTSGMIQGHISLEDYPILYDNTYYFAYTIDASKQLLSIYESKPNQYIKALAKEIEYIETQDMQIQHIEYAKISNFDVLILNELTQIPSGLRQHISDFLEQGKTVLIIPSSELDIASYNESFAQFSRHRITGIDTTTVSVSGIDKQHHILTNIFESIPENTVFPTTKTHIISEPRGRNAVMTLANGRSFISDISISPGACYLFASPLSRKHTNFVTHPLFVSIYNMIIFSRSHQDIQTYIGMPITISHQNFESQKPIQIKNQEKNIDIIPQVTKHYLGTEIQLHTFDALTEAGIYSVYQGERISQIAINYNRKESQMNFLSAQELENKIQSLPEKNISVLIGNNEMIQKRVQERNTGTQLWRYAILIALVSIFAEMCIIYVMGRPRKQ